MVNAMDAELKQRNIRVEGVGIAVPSAVDPSTGKLLNTSVLRLDGSELYARDLTARLPILQASSTMQTVVPLVRCFPAPQTRASHIFP